MKIFQYSEKYQGKSCFSGQAQVVQKPWKTKNIYWIQWVQGKHCFQIKRKLLKNP